MAPFFIVSDVVRTIAFYRDKLGFEATFQAPERDPFFAVIRRDGAHLFVKSDANVTPLPNPKRHPFMRWDAFVFAPDPDALAREFIEHGADFTAPLEDTHDGLRGFELADPERLRSIFRSSEKLTSRIAAKRLRPVRLVPAR
jgi:catechol 2,3-dioxygenase-like lactoylglutathione lyase family enzyme